MQSRLFTTAALAITTMGMTMSVDAGVIIGWETWGSTAPSLVNGDASGASVRTGTWLTSGNPAQGASTDGTFGTIAGASAGTETNQGIFVRSGTGNIVYTVTAGAQDIVLDGFHFDAIRERAGSPEFWSVDILAGGSITETAGIASSNLGGASGNNGPQDLNDIDIDLTSLADRTVEAGTSAQIRINHSGGTGASNQDTHVDNVAFTGNFVPEPTSLALLGLGGLLIARRRRG